jgi:predicted O-methyltransferase YrrM
MGGRSTGDEAASLRSRLLPGDLYAGFPIHEWALDLQGWGSRHPLFDELIGVLEPRIVVEVGTWKGASAIGMAREAKRRGLSTQIICVDTWLGSADIFLRDDDIFRALGHRHGYPQLYFQFLANVLHTGMDDVIVPLPQTSDNAARILAALDLRADLVYVDGAHDPASVRRDLASYFPLLQERGVLMGDDFYPKQRPGLVRAVREFVADHGLRLHCDREKFVVARDPDLIAEIAAARGRWRRARSLIARVHG